MNMTLAQVTPSQLALDTILRRPTHGIPHAWLNIMDWGHLERLAGRAAGDYRRDPVGVYLAVQQRIAAGFVDQWIPENPLSMGQAGYEDAQRTATTGAEEIVRDGLRIDSPEAAVEHMERFHLPALQQQIAAFDAAGLTAEIVRKEAERQRLFGDGLLKVPYYSWFPQLRYGAYGYQNYFMAYALYPEVCERCFALEGELGRLRNQALAQAIATAGLPPLLRLDHDMADSRGTLVRIETLDQRWFPHFVRSIEPLLAAGVQLIWHCDGNLMQMLPRLLDVGLVGFQGFQYEDGMDYPAICRMRTRDGEEPLIWAGVSVTRTLPHGTPDEVRREVAYLVEHGPRRGLILGASSSIAPGVPWENLQAMLEAFAHFAQHGRS